MASGALPPWFAAVEIDSEYYWDGGVVSNTPLEWLARHRLPDTLAFQVDLWAAPGELPKSVPEVMTRMKEILNSSRTIYRTDGYKEINHLYATLFRFLRQVPEEFKRGEDAEYLVSVARRCVHHLVNRSTGRRAPRAHPKITSSPAGPLRSVGSPAIAIR
jgi:NTE family protein